MDFGDIPKEILRISFDIWKKTESNLFKITNEQSWHIAMINHQDLLKQDILKNEIYRVFGFLPTMVFHEACRNTIFKTLRYCFRHTATFDVGDDITILLEKAVLIQSSDLHLYPEKQDLVIKVRIDGLLRFLGQISLKEGTFLCNRLKLLASLDIAESRRPQSGSFDQDILDVSFNFRVSTHPTLYGESVVVRLLEKNKTTTSLDHLGFDKTHIAILSNALKSPHGLILCVGPTGSGKTTTLYTLLSMLDRNIYNIMTLEDPVEYQCLGIRQTMIQKDILDFSQGLRSILRQDPDVILLGEIRDSETATMAIQAALTGHLVLATLHAKDVSSVFDRLINLGLDPLLIQSCLKSIIAQRLIRKLCYSCKGLGCDQCGHIGFEGRSVIAEVQQFPSKEFFPMINHGKAKVLSGITSQSEVDRVLGIC